VKKKAGTFVWDEVCVWPYATPYGMVTAPKVKKPRKLRTHRAKPSWLAAPKKEKPDVKRPRRSKKQQRVVVLAAPASHRQTPVLEAPPQDFAEVFVRAATQT